MDLEEMIIKAFCELNVSFLNGLDGSLIYSHNCKEVLKEEIQKEFIRIKNRGINSLIVKPSQCKYCYPKAKTYSFHHPDSDEFIIRYIIHQESENEFRVEECRNKPIPDGGDGMPF